MPSRLSPLLLLMFALCLTGSSCTHPSVAPLYEQHPPELPLGEEATFETTVPEEILPTPRLPVAGHPARLPQFVLLAFDGSQSLKMWQDTRAFAAEQTAKGAPIHFTYFINAAYLLTPATKNQYQPPQHPRGTSAIKFGFGKKDVADRLVQMNLALSEGHELGSHGVGHWNGSAWSEEEWKSELTQFATFSQGVQLPTKGFAGFRAPELGVNEDLWSALKTLGYRYDTSRVGNPMDWPKKLPNGLWEFPLALVPYNGTARKIIAMDYNFYFKQTKGVDDAAAKKGTPAWQAMHDATLKTYTDYFDANEASTRAPVQIGHHFSLWNDGVYWEAMKDFAALECGKPDVHCVTFSELADWLDAHPDLVPTAPIKKSPPT